MWLYAYRLLAELVERHGFSHAFFDLRDFGAIQYRRRRLIAWRHIYAYRDEILNRRAVKNPASDHLLNRPFLIGETFK
jgi:predicted alpha/beta hydrolase